MTPGPARPSLFGTTDVFLERLGLNSLDELPSLGDFVPGADVVEALEQGLRVEADTVETGQSDTGPSDTEQSDESAESDDGGAPGDEPNDGVTVDITDPVPLDLDAEDD